LFLRMTVVVWWYDRKFSKKTYVSAEGWKIRKYQL
jgi:hypothetical protein